MRVPRVFARSPPTASFQHLRSARRLYLLHTAQLPIQSHKG